MTVASAAGFVSPPKAVLRRDTGNWALQTALQRRGLGPVAGVDEAGRGACAGPLVVASAVLRPGDARHFEGLTDSKLLSRAERERLAEVVQTRAVSWSVVQFSPTEIDAWGIHVANIEGMRRAVAQLEVHPGYVLTDGFRVPGLASPSVAVPKGDVVAACVAAASVLAKVSRDRIMSELDTHWPAYDFATHKGYCTPAHSAALREHGPCVEHRWSYSNVLAAADVHALENPRLRAGGSTVWAGKLRRAAAHSGSAVLAGGGLAAELDDALDDVEAGSETRDSPEWTGDAFYPSVGENGTDNGLFGA